MPLPFILGVAAPYVVPALTATATAAADYTLAYIGAGVVGGVGASVGGYYWYTGPTTTEEEPPSFVDEAEEVFDDFREDGDELASRAGESLRKEDEQSKEEAKRMGEALPRMGSAATSMESNASSLAEVVDDVIASGATRSDVLHGVAEGQTEIKSGLDLHKAYMRSIEESLKNLPELLQANREKQALRLENERLGLENNGYATRIEKLLVFSKETKLENNDLKTENAGLKKKVSGYATRARDAIAMAKEKQAEIDTLRDQANGDDASNLNKAATFGVNFFS